MTRRIGALTATRATPFFVTAHSVLPIHFRQMKRDQAFRFIHRNGVELTRFLKATMQTGGERLTYWQLTGKEETR